MFILASRFSCFFFMYFFKTLKIPEEQIKETRQNIKVADNNTLFTVNICRILIETIQE